MGEIKESRDGDRDQVDRQTRAELLSLVCASDVWVVAGGTADKSWLRGRGPLTLAERALGSLDRWPKQPGPESLVTLTPLYCLQCSLAPGLTTSRAGSGCRATRTSCLSPMKSCSRFVWSLAPLPHHMLLNASQPPIRPRPGETEPRVVWRWEVGNCRQIGLVNSRSHRTDTQQQVDKRPGESAARAARAKGLGKRLSTTLSPPSL